MKHYLLTAEPWIPVRRRNGSYTDLSLRELFAQGREIADLSLPPGPRIALMRFLLCLVARSLPLPQNESEWAAAPERIAPQALAYLTKWESAFDLYGDRPFLQVVGLGKEWNATLDKLDFSLASGNNHTLFDHLAGDQGRPHPPAWQTLMLLVTQNFSAGGLIGPNTWQHLPTNSLSGNISSPALEGSPLHTFLLGDDILETLHLNLIPADELGNVKIGIPVWERPPADAAEAQAFRDTLLGRLAPLSRAIRLPEEGTAISFAVACNYAQISEFIDPYLGNRRTEKTGTLSYLRLQPERHPWRELESLLALQTSPAGVTPPKHLQNRNRIPTDKALHLWCGGIAVDKAKYIFSGEWVFSFQTQAQYREEALVSLGHFARASEQVAEEIKSAVNLFWKNLAQAEKKKSGDSATVMIQAGKEQTRNRILLAYWQHVDASVAAAIEVAGEELPDFPDLYRQLRDTAENLFAAALPTQSPRGLIAEAETLPYFRKKLKDILGDHITEKGEREDGE